MSVYKKVVNAFVFVCKTRKAASLTKSRKFFIAAGKQFMGITLMTYIPDNGIFRAVENAVKRNCEFNDAKVTCKVTAVFSNNIDNSRTDFLSKLPEFFLRKLFDVFGRMYF